MEIIVILVQEFYFFSLMPNSLNTYHSDGFHSDVIKLQSQNGEVLRILTHTSLKINKIKIFVVSSPEACFISKT